MKKLHTLILCFALLLAACSDDNLFGSGSKNNNCGNDIKCWRIEAENAFRASDFKGSYDICDTIVKRDPTSSFGYFGKAKASLWDRGINPFSMFYLVKPKEGECPFMGDHISTKVRNDFFQAMKGVVPALTELDRRDTLTALYERYKSGDVLDSALIDFIEKFCGGGNVCTDSITNEKFPLSDREFKSSYFRGILLISTLSKTILNLLDTQNGANADSCLTRSADSTMAGIEFPEKGKWADWGCTKEGKYDLPISLKCPVDPITGKMNVIIDSEKILDALNLDKYYGCLQDNLDNPEVCVVDVPPGVNDINETIDNFDGDFNDIENILNNLGLGGSEIPGDSASGGLKEELDKYKDYASFYKVGTGTDLDGDGCIDEELLDGQDNDGDGFISENARLAPTDPSVGDLLYGISSVKTPWNNKPMRLPSPVRICNASDYKLQNCPELLPDSTDSVTVMGFTQELYPTGKKYWTTRDMKLKLKIAQDTKCNNPEFGSNLKEKLKYRIDNIGGCWPYYDPDNPNSLKEFEKKYCK